MIRPLAFAPLLLLAACAHHGTPERFPGGEQCHADRVQDLVGKPRSDALAQTARKRAGAAMIRWIPMGVMVTMEYRAGRLNLRLGPDGKVTAITCG